MLEYSASISLSRIVILLVVSNIVSVNSYAQEDIRTNENKRNSILDAAGRYKPRPKFVELEFEIQNNFEVQSSSELVGNAGATINQNLVRQAKIKFPLILKKEVNLIAGFDYRHEQFLFGSTTDPEYPLYVRFEDKPLKKVSSSFYFKKTLKGNKFFLGYLNNSLNSDEIRFRKFLNQLKSSIVLTLGKQVNPHKQIGYGLSFGYDLGQPLVLPVFFYNNAFSLHWGLEMLLPKSVKLRYSPSFKTHYYIFTQLQGASYHIQDEVLAGFDKLEFRRSSVRLNVRVEKELHDWLWFGITAGYREPINIFLSEPGQSRSNSIIKVHSSGTFYYNLSIFLVPPNNLYKKAKGS